MASTKTLDTITLRNLHTTCCIGPDAWSRPGKQQPLLLTLALHLDTSAAGATDDIDSTFSYGIMCKDVLAAIEGGDFESMRALVEGIVRVARGWPGVGLRVGVVAMKALLRVEGGLGLEVSYEREIWGWRRGVWEWGVRGLRCACVVGVNEHERGERQGVVLGLGLGLEGVLEEGVFREGAWRELVRGVCEVRFFCPFCGVDGGAEGGDRLLKLRAFRLWRRWRRSLLRLV